MTIKMQVVVVVVVLAAAKLSPTGKNYENWSANGKAKGKNVMAGTF